MVDLKGAEKYGLYGISRETHGDGDACLDADEDILESFDAIQLVLGQTDDRGLGKLVITDGRMVWLSERDATLGLCADFSDISMHAVATDPSTVEKPCLYIQIDGGEENDLSDGWNEEEEEGVEEENDNGQLNGQGYDEESLTKELRLIPAEPGIVDNLFQAFCDGAERNPDAMAEEEGQNSLFFDHSSMIGALSLSEAAAVPGDDDDDNDDSRPEQYEDAEEDEADN